MGAAVPTPRCSVGQRDRADAGRCTRHPCGGHLRGDLPVGDPGIAPGVRRTLERRIAGWPARSMVPIENVIFRQEHPPGRMGLSDFTDMGGSASRCRGAFDHRLITSGSAFSGFEHAHVVLGGESSAALAQGRQNAPRASAAAEQHRSDSLSAAIRNLDRVAQDDLTRRYEELCRLRHDAVAQQLRRRARERLDRGFPWAPQESASRWLSLRGSREFEHLAADRRFIDEVVGGAMPGTASASRSRIAVKQFPDRRTTDYEEAHVLVTSSAASAPCARSTASLRVGSATVSNVHLYDDRLECLPRLLRGR